jgi:DNA-binding CsgD family transcriptional regulator
MVAILKHRNLASAREKNTSRLHALLRAISQGTASAGDQVLTRYGGDRSERILLDADLDGARYVLVRIPLAQSPHLSLSPRQWEIVRLIAQGHPNKRIAALLNLSLWTIGTHVRRIFTKLGVNSRAAMVTRLLEAGEGGDLALGTWPAARRQVDDGAAFTAGFARPQARSKVVTTLAVLPGSRSRAAGVRLSSANGGSRR